MYLLGIRSIWFHHTGYAHCKVEKTRLTVHRLVWVFENGPVPRRLMADHKNRNKLDNRITNLRLASAAQNNANGKPYKNRKYRGVTKLASGNFKAKVGSARTVIDCGVFKTEKEAALAYNKAAKKRFGEFAVLNKV